jgi:hypothetical protein
MKSALTTQLIALLLFCSIIADAQKCESIASTNAPAAGEKILLISDNQEHMLTGTQPRSMSGWMDYLASSYALRSPLANIGGRSLLKETLQFGNEQGAGLVLHLGDASDISCPDELESVFTTLDKETEKPWFFTPGNHDGLFAGNFDRYQPGRDEGPEKLYKKVPAKGYGAKPSWLRSCYSFSNHLKPKKIIPPKPDPNTFKFEISQSDVMTKNDAIQLYLNHLSDRGSIEREKEPEPAPVAFIGGNEVPCWLEKLKGPADFQAIARICPRVTLKGETTWLGPFASFIVQKLKIGDSIVLLIDTSDYYHLALKDFAGDKGGVQREQIREADSLLGNSDPANVIIAGHHRFTDLPPLAREWIAKRAGRYLSGHAHHSTRIFEHIVNRRRIKELNIGSTIDHPQQAVIATLNGSEGSFRVAGADFDKTGWPKFLQACKDNPKWKLDDKFYKTYRNGRYINRLLDALREAAKSPDSGMTATPIPDGEKIEDWDSFEQILNSINFLKGGQRKFWACQAYFASEATKGERSVQEILLTQVFQNPGNWWRKSGCDATGGWYRFSSL